MKTLYLGIEHKEMNSIIVFLLLLGVKYWRIISTTSVFLCWMDQHSLTRPLRKTEQCLCSCSCPSKVPLCHACSLRGSVEKITQQNLIVKVIKYLQILYSYAGKKNHKQCY